MQGQWVIVRNYGGVPRVCRVWEADKDTIFVVSKENYERLAAHLNGLRPVGRARADVYEFDAELMADYEAGRISSDQLWATLQSRSLQAVTD